MPIADARRKLDAALAQRQALELQKKTLVKQLSDSRDILAATTRAQEVAQETAEQVQRQAYGSISTIVTRCLQQVWGEEAYEFVIDVAQKRGKTEAKFVLRRDGMQIDDPTAACGGGVVDVIAFALRLAALKLASPKRRLLLVADEPFRFVSKEYRPAVASMILALAKDMGVQIIMVTHIEDLEIGNVITIGEEDEIPF